MTVGTPLGEVTLKSHAASRMGRCRWSLPLLVVPYAVLYAISKCDIFLSLAACAEPEMFLSLKTLLNPGLNLAGDFTTLFMAFYES